MGNMLGAAAKLISCVSGDLRLIPVPELIPGLGRSLDSSSTQSWSPPRMYHTIHTVLYAVGVFWACSLYYLLHVHMK